MPGLFGCKRSDVVPKMAWFSVLLAAYSLWSAYQIRRTGTCDATGYGILGFWAIAPPVWFLTEYYYWPPDKNDEERVRHLHELSRNIWIAMVIVLAQVMGAKWPGS